MRRRVCTVLFWSLSALACSADQNTGPVSASEFGRALFRDPRLSESEFNAFACATCHIETEAVDPKRIQSGHSLYNSAFRPSWWGGYEARYIDAVNFCYIYFMRGLEPLSRDAPRSKALYEYLVSISPDRSAPALPLTVVRDIADVPRGTTDRGEEVYRAACETCHGAPHTGEARITALAPVLPEYVTTFEATFPGVDPALVLIEKVRHGQFFQVGGNMPLFGQEALSDADLGALLAFMGL